MIFKKKPIPHTELGRGVISQRYYSVAWISTNCASRYPVGPNIMSWLEEGVPMYWYVLKEIDKSMCLWVMGSSGAILGALLADKIYHELEQRVTVAYINKEKETSHHGETEDIFPEHYDVHIIVDDLLASGNTVSKLFQAAYDMKTQIDMVLTANSEPLKLKNTLKRLKYGKKNKRIIFV